MTTEPNRVTMLDGSQMTADVIDRVNGFLADRSRNGARALMSGGRPIGWVFIDRAVYGGWPPPELVAGLIQKMVADVRAKVVA